MIIQRKKGKYLKTIIHQKWDKAPWQLGGLKAIALQIPEQWCQGI